MFQERTLKRGLRVALGCRPQCSHNRLLFSDQVVVIAGTGNILAVPATKEAEMMANLSFTLNGKPVSLNVDPDRKLLWVLRTDLGLTGAKYGCGQGHCGACTVLVDNRTVRSCVFPARGVEGKKVVTVEGLAENGKLHPLQEAFVEHDALQCGFCTPGMILNAYSLLLRNPQPTRRQIIEGMERNLCRCGSHGRIIRAIESAAQIMKGGA